MLRVSSVIIGNKKELTGIVSDHTRKVPGEIGNVSVREKCQITY
jgi:hypothetical protein